MSIARNLAALLDSSGDVVAGALDNAGGGGSTVISSQTITGTPTSITFSSLNLSAYRVVRLEFYTVKTTSNQYHLVKTSNDGFTTNNSWDFATTASFDNTQGTYMRDDGSYMDSLFISPWAEWNTITYGISGYMDFIVDGPKVLVNGIGSSYDDGETAVIYAGVIDATTFTDLKIQAHNGNWVSGTFKLIGMA